MCSAFHEVLPDQAEPKAGSSPRCRRTGPLYAAAPPPVLTDGFRRHGQPPHSQSRPVGAHRSQPISGDDDPPWPRRAPSDLPLSADAANRRRHHSRGMPAHIVQGQAIVASPLRSLPPLGPCRPLQLYQHGPVQVRDASRFATNQIWDDWKTRSSILDSYSRTLDMPESKF